MLNNIGLPGLLLIAVVTLLLFGRGKVGTLMGEVGTGLAAFRKGLREGADDTPALDGKTPIQTPIQTSAQTPASRPEDGQA